MSRFRVFTVLVVLVAVVVASVPAQAGDHPHTRQGFVLGFGLGGGSAQGRVDGDSDVLVETDRTGGVAFSLRLGYAVSPRLVLGLESSGWGRSDEERLFGETAEIKTTLAVTTIGATWYPTEGGFYARLGLGIGVARQEYDFGTLNAEIEESGGALLLATGYEWRLSRTFALGAQFDVGVIGLGDIEVADGMGGTEEAKVSFDFTNLSVTANWYFGS